MRTPLRSPELHVPKGKSTYDTLRPMIGGTLNLKAIPADWNEILCLAASIKHGKVTASLMLRKLGSYPRQNGRKYTAFGVSIILLPGLVRSG